MNVILLKTFFSVITVNGSFERLTFYFNFFVNYFIYVEILIVKEGFKWSFSFM